MSLPHLHRALLGLASDLGGPLLALDTSGPSASVCTVGFQAELVDEALLEGRAMPSESLVAAIAARLERHALKAGALKAMVVGLGPGSFTGLRVGLALCKGLAVGAAIPLLGVSSLGALAISAGPGLVLAVRDARKGELFATLREVGADEQNVLVDDACLRASEVQESLVALGDRSVRVVTDDLVKDGIEALLERPVEAASLHASAGLWLAAGRLRAGEVDAVEHLVPSYLQLSEPERRKLAQASEVS